MQSRFQLFVNDSREYFANTFVNDEMRAEISTLGDRYF